MKQVGIIGAGVMGTDIAQAFVLGDFKVTLIDNEPIQFDKAKEKIKTNLRFQKLHSKTKMPSLEQVLSNIQFSNDLHSLKSTDFIIENITEDWDLKKDLHMRLETIVSPHSTIAINTSAISITKIASLKKEPKNVIGVHFMNPAYIMPTVEVIRGYHTSEDTLLRTQNILSLIGKKSIVVKDSPGFVTNRAMMIFVNEAIYCLAEGIASAEEIDTLFKECFGHKMGPLQTADLIGLDTILKSLQVLYESFNEDKYRPCVYLKKLVDAGLLGAKSGQGFYQYVNSN